MKRLLTYGWLLLTLLASLFVVSACQDDVPTDTTEVMMTFTTRAFVEATKGDTVSTHLNEEKMKDLRVIMVRENGEIVGNHKEEGINQTSVTFTFRTPVKTGGEYFTFFAIANEGSVTPAINTSLIERAEGNSYSSDELNSLKSYQIGESEFELSESKPIPQTKQWIIKVPQQDTKIDNQRLEYVASKILVEFRNQTNKAQTLKNIKLTGIATPTSGYLFKQDENDFVGTQQGASDITLIGEEGITLATEASDSVKYYTYPVNGISNAQLVATWEGVGERTLALDCITSLPRNQQLKIIVTLTGQELTVNYTIADWEEHDTNIGGTSPTPEGGYDTEDWIADSNTDVVIGEEPEQGGGEEPEEPVEPGDVIWHKDSLSITPNYNTAPIEQPLTNDDLSYFVSGNILGIKYDIAEQNSGREIYIRSMQATGGYNDNSLNGNVFSDEGYSELVLSEDNATAIKNDGGIEFWGNGVTITQIYIKEASTQ